MLELKIMMNSSVEEILDFKCCHLQGMNLELSLKNQGDESFEAPTSFKLEPDEKSHPLFYLYPPWTQQIEPGTCLSLYCNMSDNILPQYRIIRFFTKDQELCHFEIKECLDQQNTPA